MIKLITILILLFTTQVALAEKDVLNLEVDNHTLAIISGVLIVADWGTTLDIENHDNIYEENKVLGRHPSRGKVNTYFVGKLLLHWYLNTNRYTRKYKNLWNGSQIYITGKAVKNNFELGLEMAF